MKRFSSASHNSYVREILCILAIATAGVLTAETPEPQVILQRSHDAYSHLKSYRIEDVTSIESTGPDFDQVLKTRQSIAAEPPGKFRVEVKGPGGMTTVMNGNQTWAYNPFLKQYTKTETSKSRGQLLPVTVLSMVFAEGTGETVKSMKVAQEDDVQVQGTPHKCYVLELQYDAKPAAAGTKPQPPLKLWIDETNYLVLKRVSAQHMGEMPMGAGPMDMKITTTVESFTLNEPLSPDLFTFVPPADAKLVTSFEYPGMKKSDLVSKPAPDFTLKDLDGKEYRLSSFRGKTVVLDFWATWCAPCRAEMPGLEQLHKDYDRVVFLGIDVGEERELVQKFAAENKVTYPILLSGRQTVPNDYQAQTLPTVVVIDGNGVVRTHNVGYGPASDEQLRAAVESAAKPQVAATSPAPAGVFRVGSGVSAPTVLSKREPQYSEEARRAQLSGTVLLSLVVDTDGSPRNIQVVRSLGSHLDENAIECVRDWKFKPGTKNGEPVAVQANIEVNFRLLDSQEVEPRTAEEAYRRGEKLIRDKHVPEGVAMLDKAIAMNPAWAQAFAARGRAEYQQKRYSEAIVDFTEAIRLDPKRPAFYDGRGLAYSYSGRQALAIEDYNRAIELNPNGSSAYYNNRGWAYSDSGRPELGIADLTRAIEMAPDYGLAFQNRANAYVKMKDWDHAIADYTAAIELNSTPLLLERRAEAKRSKGDVAGADAISAEDSADPSLPAPKLVAPAEGEVFNVYPRHTVVSWEPSPGAVSYLVEWEYQSNGTWFPRAGNFAAEGTTVSFDFIGAQPGRWRVWPVGKDGRRGNSSEWRTFRYTR